VTNAPLTTNQTTRRTIPLWFSELALLGVPLLAWFITASQLRFIDGDEGFYVYASKLVAAGELPYRDFFYPQMPLLPFLYGWWCELFGMNWNVARVLSGLAGAASGFLLYRYLLRTVPRSLALLGVVLFSTTSLTMIWTSVVKTMPFTTLGVLSALFLLPRSPTSSSWLRIVLAGVLIGLTVSLRLMVAPLVPLFGVFVLCSASSIPDAVRRGTLFSLGFLLGSLPWIIPAISAWDYFWYNNYGYHATRSQLSPFREVLQRQYIFLAIWGMTPSRELANLQLPLLHWTAAFYALYSLVKRLTPDRALATAFLIGALNLVPTPTYFQYFAVSCPFLIICLVHLIHRDLAPLVAAPLSQKFSLRVVAPALIALVWSFGFIPGALRDFERFTRTGKYDMGNRHPGNPSKNTLAATQGISRIISVLTVPGEQVAAVWPGHLFETHARVARGFENHFGWRAAQNLAPHLHPVFHVFRYDQLLARMQDRSVRLFVGNAAPNGGRIPIERMTALGFSVLKTFGPLAILVPAEERERYTAIFKAAYPELEIR
jgi:hypothetical protein